MATWVLLLVLSMPSGSLLAVGLSSFQTEQDCEKKLLEIAPEMKSAYPDDEDYFLICKCHVQGVACPTSEGDISTITP